MKKAKKEMFNQIRQRVTKYALPFSSIIIQKIRHLEIIMDILKTENSDFLKTVDTFSGS